MGNSNRFGWIKVRSGDTSYVGSVKHSHCVLYMHEQIQQGYLCLMWGRVTLSWGVMERPVCNILTI